jgi:hypothetical protein
LFFQTNRALTFVLVGATLLAAMVALAANPAAATSAPPSSMEVGGGTLSFFSFPQAPGPASGCAAPASTPSAVQNATAGSRWTLCASWTPAARNGTQTLVLVLRTVPALAGFDAAQPSMRFSNLTAASNATAAQTTSLNVTIASNATAGSRVQLVLNATVLQGTKVLGTAQGDAWAFTVVRVPAPGPSLLLPEIVAAIVVLVLLVLAVALSLRRRQVRAAPRSAAMRHAQLEEQIERAKPEEAAQLRQEAVREEQTRALSREAAIVQAKIRDVEAGLDRLRARKDSGRLSQYQFDQMSAERNAELARLQAELRNLEG